MPVNGPREKLAADLELLKPVAGHVAYWSCGLIAGQSLTLGDLRALLAEPTPAPMSDIGMAISDALRQVGAALREVVALMRQSDGVIGFHLNGEVLAWSEFDLEDKIADALALLPALAQQMVEGEQKIAELESANKELHFELANSYCPACKSCGEIGCCPVHKCKFVNAHQGYYDDVAAELNRTREALAVAEGALKPYRWRKISDIHEDYGPCVLMNIEDPGYLEVGSNLDTDFDMDEWTHFAEVPKLTQAQAVDLIAALSPTGTPGAEGEPTV